MFETVSEELIEFIRVFVYTILRWLDVVLYNRLKKIDESCIGELFSYNILIDEEKTNLFS